MSLREFAKKQVMDFFMVSTLAGLAMYILGSSFLPGNQFSYEVLLMPLMYGLVGTIPGWIMYSSKELTVKQLIVRKILHFFALEVMLILVTFGFGKLTMEYIDMILSFAVSVLVVNVIVILVERLLELREASELTLDLQEYQKQHSESE